MTTILFLKETIYCNLFRWYSLRNKKPFLKFFFHFQNLDSILNIFKKKIALIANVFRTYGVRKTWLDKCLKSPA